MPEQKGIKKSGPRKVRFLFQMARVTGLEPATPGVTGRYSNQLSYTRSPFGDGGDTGFVC